MVSDYLNEHSMCLRYLDDENNRINREHGDDRGLIEFGSQLGLFPKGR